MELATGEVLEVHYDEDLYASPAIFALELAEEKLLTEDEQVSIEAAISSHIKVP